MQNENDGSDEDVANADVNQNLALARKLWKESVGYALESCIGERLRSSPLG
jgi:hypothetical protein